MSHGVDLPILVSGAGLSGLCLAQSLVRSRFDVQVYERDPAPDARRQGYRTTLDEFGVAALKRCLPTHLFEAVRATASKRGEMGYMRFTNHQLVEIFKLTFERPADQTGAFWGQVDRATLRTIMLSGLEGRVHFGKTASRVDVRPECAELHFTDGSSARGSLVIGADGIRSPLRAQLLPDCPIIDTGARAIYGKTRLIRDGASLIPTSLETSGVMALGETPGIAFFFTAMSFDTTPSVVFATLVPGQEPPVCDDYIMWAVLLPEDHVPSDFLELSPEALHRFAANASREFHPVMQSLIAYADVDYTIATTLSAATRPNAWPGSRATLMGDAAHAMPPTGAHGGNTALRDAALLAEMLGTAAESAQPIDAVVQRYQQRMLAYSFKEVDASTSMLRRMQMRSPLLRFLMLRAIPRVRSLVGASPGLE